MKPQGGKGNRYASQLVLMRRMGAIHRGKAAKPFSHSSHHRPNHVGARSLPLLDDFANFERSAIPARVMFFCDENWKDFPSEALETMKKAFGSGEASAVVEIDGSSSLVDFLRMMQFDLTDGSKRSIAWIDVKGKCFFPRKHVGGEKPDCDSCSPIKLKIEVKIDGVSKASDQSETRQEGRSCRGGNGVEDGLIGCMERRRDPGNGEKFREGENGVECDKIGRKERGSDSCRQPNLLKGQGIVARLPDLNEDVPVDGNSREAEEKRIMEPHFLRENCTVEGLFANRVQDKEPQNLENTNKGAQCSLRKRNLDCLLNPNEKQDRDDMPDSKRVHFTSSESIKSVCIVQGKSVYDLNSLKLMKLTEGNKSYIKVRDLFMRGMQNISSKTRVDSIYWCSHASQMSSARLQVFHRNIEIMKSARGDANVRNGWYGASSKAIESIIQHGFGQVETRSGPEAYGTGIYLSAENYSQASASLLGPDDDGMFHVMLCRVIMGNMEQIKLGSSQSQPSNEGFDSGVDNLRDPRLYVVWSTHMNTHILPECIVSFRVSEQLEESWRRGQFIQDSNAIPVSLGASTENFQPCTNSPIQVLPASHPHPSIRAQEQYKEKLPSLAAIPNMSFPLLFSAMSRSLPQPSIERLEKVYNDYKAGNIEKDVLIRTIRSIAGDKLVIAAAHSICNQAGSNNVKK